MIEYAQSATVRSQQSSRRICAPICSADTRAPLNPQEFLVGILPLQSLGFLVVASQAAPSLG